MNALGPDNNEQKKRGTMNKTLGVNRMKKGKIMDEMFQHYNGMKPSGGMDETFGS